MRNTLGAYKCDVIMGVPQGDDLVQVTNPYYRTAYALVFKHGQRPRRAWTLSATSGSKQSASASLPARRQATTWWPTG